MKFDKRIQFHKKRWITNKLALEKYTYLRFEEALYVNVKTLLFERTGESVGGDGLQPGQQRQIAVVKITLLTIAAQHLILTGKKLLQK